MAAAVSGAVLRVVRNGLGGFFLVRNGKDRRGKKKARSWGACGLFWELFFVAADVARA